MNVLPPRLDALLGALERPVRHPVIVRGWGSDCGNDEHHWAVWLEGLYRPTVPVAGSVVQLSMALRVSVCTLCETVEVRDVSFDRLDGLPTGRSGPRRRDKLLGWYTGARRANRIYH